MTRTRLSPLAAGTLLALFALAPNGHAQTMALQAAPRIDAAARAGQLHGAGLAATEAVIQASAAGRSVDPVQQYRRAARLHIRSAALRPANDPQASACLREAAGLLHAVDPAKASALMESAGEKALAHGDVFAAAQAFIHAAELVTLQRQIDQSQLDRAKSLSARGRLLTRSPLLTKAQRTLLATRS